MIKCNFDIINKAIDIVNNKHCVIMCSGGVDSIAATHYMLSNLVLDKEMIANHNSFCVFHYNHNLREQNQEMAKMFSKFMEDFFIRYWSIIETRQKDLPATEAILREDRLKSISSRFHRSIIVTAHHLDDCVESYLLNCFRGHTDYQPIPFITEYHTNPNMNVITHPFLFTKKQDFIDYAVKYDLMKYVVEDNTNTVVKGSRRNFIRNEIIPLLKREKMGLATIVKKKMQHRLLLDLIK
jgi:tRNA(Ile)-lysidine synthase TilS/MesJ